MRKQLVVTGTLAVATAGAVFLVSPSFAATPEPGSSSATCAPGQGMGQGARQGRGVGQGQGMRQGQGQGQGQRQGQGQGQGQGRGPGSGMGTGDLAATLPAMGTLTAAQKATLAAMAEEEKVAHDVYVKLGTSSGDARFTRIAAAEQRHLDLVRVVLTRYGVADPTVGKAAGEFASAQFTTMYADAVARGSLSRDGALEVGRSIEKADVADLTAAAAGLAAPDVSAVYERLLAGSQMHLRAFGG